MIELNRTRRCFAGLLEGEFLHHIIKFISIYINSEQIVTENVSGASAFTFACAVLL